MRIDWTQYDPGSFYDELFAAPAQAKPARRPSGWRAISPRSGMRELAERQRDAERAIAEMGITFTVYTEGQNIDRAWPFDVIPRTIEATEWARIERGLIQRLTALNRFIDDLYHDQRIIADGVVPDDLIATSANFLPACIGANPPHGVWANICGSDLVRDRDGTVYVLEDNLRVPSGVSYMLENRAITKQVFPEMFEHASILPVDDYASRLFDMLASLSPRKVDFPRVVVLTPGIYNSAYFEHSYLAQRMGVDLVEGADLVVADDECVYVRTIRGLERVDVIYRRINDTFLDPECFEKDSVLGVPGLMRAWRAQNVALANAPGAGVADDKVVYAYVPKIIEYYLGEKADPAERADAAAARRRTAASTCSPISSNWVVKPANESGGYGMLIGPRATDEEKAAMAAAIEANPRNYIAQPVLALSTAPTLVQDEIEPRHLDLRPFILQGQRIWVTPGGLTRVALRRGSLVVNSSQGGGSKDTWIVAAES